MRIYIIRHADPDYPNNTITSAGHLEAAALAVRMEAAGLDRLYSSPLGRARDTARYTAERTGLPVGIEPWTAELEWYKNRPDMNSSHAVWDYPGEVFRSHESIPTVADWEQSPAIADSALAGAYAELISGSDDFLARHGYTREGRRYRLAADAPTHERIAVFCHGGFGLTWLGHLLEIPPPVMWSGFWLPPTSVSMVLMEQQSDEWAVPRCVGLGDTAHLAAAGLPIAARGMYARNW